MKEGDDDGEGFAGGGGILTDETQANQHRVPLKTILQNFLSHVEDLENRRMNDTDDAYEKEFQSLKLFSDQIKCQSDFSSSEGEKDVNRKKNRYKDILPFDYTRVALSEFPGIAGSDYINANFIKGASGSNAYIACQGPLPHTVNDFWRMVVECEVQVIVMACNEQEAGKHKCEKYWTDADDVSEEQSFGKYSVALLKSREICPDFLVRTMRLRWKNGDSVAAGDEDEYDEERTVCQFHYSAWPDHGIPTQVKPLLEMVRLIRDCQASETLPVLIHCSAGCGRTGTICAIDFIWGLLRTGKLSSDFSLYELVKDMRRQRIAMVQTVDQYVLVHRAVKELFLEQLRVIDAHPYENVDDDGRPLCGQGKTDDHVVPDYETIFVNNPDAVAPIRDGSEGTMAPPIDSIEIDKILTNRMMQYDQLSRKVESGSPPNPPPKQRNLDSKVVDTREVNIPLAPQEPEPSVPIKIKPEPVLFDPPVSKGTPNKENGGLAGANLASQRFKKGNLRLTQTKDGDWKLEELDADLGLESKTQQQQQLVTEGDGGATSDLRDKETPANTPEKKKSKIKSRKDGSEASSPKSELLRKPSIKKIKAFFNKDKDNSSSSSSSVENSPPNGDRDVVSAISKLPKFEPGAKMPIQTGEGAAAATVPTSKSVPNSLDRKSAERTIEPEVLRHKPVLPVKRSKSMKNGLQKEQQHQASQNRSCEEGSNNNNTPVITDIYANPLPKPKRSIPAPSEDLSSAMMASFDVAERESQRLLEQGGTSHSSPNSSYKSPTSSYNKYDNKSPGGSYNKYDSSSYNKYDKSPSSSYNKYDQSPGSSYSKSPRGQQRAVTSRYSPKQLEASDTRNFARNKDHSVENLVHDYANVHISKKNYDSMVAMEAQRKVSEAVVSSRERRNSFREAVQQQSEANKADQGRKQPPCDSSVWVKQTRDDGERGGGSPHYVNLRCGPQQQQQSVQYSEEQGSPLGYEPVNFKDGKLHSVSLVSDVISNNSRIGGGGRTHYEGSHVIARKQNSNSSGGSSVAGGGSNRPPPPYKQPPNIGNGNKIQQQQQPSDYIQNSKRRPSPTTTPSRSEHHEQEVRNCHNHHYQNVSGLYANLVPNRDRAFARPMPNATNDDLALTYYQQQQYRQSGAVPPASTVYYPPTATRQQQLQPRLNTSYNEGVAAVLRPAANNNPAPAAGSMKHNRFSYGDFSSAVTSSHYLTNTAGSNLERDDSHEGLTVKALRKDQQQQMSLHSAGATTPSTSSPGSGESGVGGSNGVPRPPRQVPPPLGRGHPGGSSSTGDLMPNHYQLHHQARGDGATGVTAPGSGGNALDLDSIAAAMKNQGRGTTGGTPSTSMSVSMSALANIGGGPSSNSVGSSSSRPPIGRAIAGVLSGAAANLRSRFSNLGGAVGSGSPNSSDCQIYPEMSTSPPTPKQMAPARSHHQLHPQREVAPSDLPMTVPGAAAVASVVSPYPPNVAQNRPGSHHQHQQPSIPLSQPAFPYSFPHRLESRPAGPREPPQMFNQHMRKQEYL